MGDETTQILSAIHEIRDLMRLIAEPAIAERDRKLRGQLRQIVGKSVPRRKSVLLMDGSRPQIAIHRATGIHKGDLSTLVKQINESHLLNGDPKKPNLAISIPATFFDDGEEA